MFIAANTDNIVSKPDFTRHPAELLDQYSLAPAANVGDVFDRLKVLDSGIRCLTGNAQSLRQGGFYLCLGIGECNRGWLLKCQIFGQHAISRAGGELQHIRNGLDTEHLIACKGACRNVDAYPAIGGSYTAARRTDLFRDGIALWYADGGFQAGFG